MLTDFGINSRQANLLLENIGWPDGVPFKDGKEIKKIKRSKKYLKTER